MKGVGKVCEGYGKGVGSVRKRIGNGVRMLL